MLFKDLIKELRLKCLLSQKELAECIKSDQTSVSYYEMGKRNPGLKTLKKTIDFANKKGIKVNYTDIGI
jgi:transcriptional regulator with XRE-family HTH domain